MKVGSDFESDLRRGKLIRSIIDDPQYFPTEKDPRDSNDPELKGKNAGATGAVLMIDANQVWDVNEAIEYTKGLAQIKPWYVCGSSSFDWVVPISSSRFIEEPTAPDDILGHATIRKALKPSGIGVATGEHAHNRMIFKQLLQAEAIDVCQVDSVRLGGVSEVLAVLLMAAKFGVPVCPHAGGVGLCEHVIHLRLALFTLPAVGSTDCLEFDRLYCGVRYHGKECPRVC